MSAFANLARRIDAWIFQTRYLATHGLGLFRVCSALGFLLLTTPGHREFMRFVPVGELPDTQFSPPFGPMLLLTGLPDARVLSALELLVTIGLVSLALGFFTRASALGTAAVLLFLLGVQYSAGKIDHPGLIPVLMLVLLSFTNWGDTWSLDAVRRRQTDVSQSQRAEATQAYQWVGVFIALMLGLAYLAAGLPKLLGGWPSPSSQAVHNLVDIYSFRVGDSGLLVAPMMRLDSKWAWELLDFLGTFWEVGFIAAIFSLRTFRAGLATAAIFHLGNALILGIMYYPLLWVYALFLDWDVIASLRPLARLRERLVGAASMLARPLVAAPVILAAAGSLYAFGSPVPPLAELLLPRQWSLEFALHVIGAGVGVAYLVYACGTLISRWRRGPLSAGGPGVVLPRTQS